MIKICHITSAHPRYDVRIFEKECVSLCESGYEVFLIVNDLLEAEDCRGINISSVPCKTQSRLKRFAYAAKKVYEKAAEVDADLYHVHDPELLPYGLKLKRNGKKVIFDSHEDVPSQILDKGWIPAFLRRIISGLYKRYESHVVKRLDAVVAATPHIAEKFKGRAKIVEVVNNYPKLDDILFHDKPFAEREKILCYAGGISEQRGEKVMLEAVEGLDATLILAGDHEKHRTGQAVYTGKLNREQVNELYGRSVAGMVTLLPTASYIYSQPIKMFEYMAAGLPFVASDFPLWKSIVEENGCGICVDCGKADEVRAAVVELLEDPCRAQEMGRNGRRAVETRYNWNVEEKKLVSLYRDLLGKG
ncbi:MAG: glycosyltransferase family 4 protein [Lachnospiraceae bacterium]|nr:glycosyltransferase family 4 protein [Lachnospiraceae bacterium]